MKLVFNVAVLLAVFFPQALPQETPEAVRRLRAGLGGDEAIRSIARIHIDGKITNAQVGTGSAESFCEMPGRFVQKIDTVIKGGGSMPSVPNSRPQPYDPATAGERLAEPPLDLARGDAQHSSYVGMADGEPLVIGLRLPELGRDESRERLLNAARHAFARTVIPLLGGAPGIQFAGDRHGTLIFRDEMGAEWQLTLDASGRPSTLTWHVTPGSSRRVYAGAPEWVSTFSDYRASGAGVTWPHRITTTLEGRPYEELTIRKYEINGKISAKVFR